MPAPVSREGEPPRKRARLEHSSKGAYRFSKVEDVRRSLRSQNQDGLVEALLALRNQFTIKAGEPVLPQDERLTFAQSWLEQAPGAHEVFELWENVNHRQAQTLALIVSVLAVLLNLLSSHYTHHSLGLPIVKTLLSTQWMQLLNTYVTGSHNELVMASLKLLNAMSIFAGGRERKSVLDGFAWETKSLPKLLTMRRKSKTGQSGDILTYPDIRTLYILFILSFVDTTAQTSVKVAFLEQRRDIFSSMWKGFLQDPYSLVRKILEVSWAGIWSDPKVKRTLKVNLFNETCLGQIARLYDRSAPEAQEDDQIPADVVHHFLLAICTRPGVGVCFKDRGWYPRETEEDARPVAEDGDDMAPKSSRIHNKILAHVLKGLKVNEDPRQQELALKIVTACPELVAGYWTAAALTLEPRLSSKWIANIAFFGSVIALPVPEASFLLPSSTLYLPSPPPLPSFLENTLPSVGTKVHFSRGLQASSPLVQHCTAQVLAKCLTKYAQVLEFLRKAEGALEEDEETGLWGQRRRELEREVRRRVPDFQVIVAISQQHKQAESALSAQLMEAPANVTRAALLAESATRLLWLYHKCLPSLVAEARFDVGKLLQNVSDFTPSIPDDPSDALSGLHTVRTLHILRLLEESDQFAWSTKTGAHSPVYVLLKLYASADIAAVRSAIESLLRHVFSESILFQHDPDEVYLWLTALPVGVRTDSAETPDGTPLTDEQQAVSIFLDDCVQRCLKTPYRYLEELQVLVPESDDSSNAQNETRLTPLVMTVLEQLAAKTSSGLLSPSDMLALVSFVRKLLLNFAGKLQDLRLIDRLGEKLASGLAGDKMLLEHAIVQQAISREIDCLRAYLQSLRGVEPSQMASAGSNRAAAVQDFLLQVEQLPIPLTKNARKSSAFELVDWLRLADSTLHNDEIARLVVVIERLYPSAIKELLAYVDPGQRLTSEFVTLHFHSSFEIVFQSLFLHSGPQELAEPTYRDVLAQAVFGTGHPLLQAKSALLLIGHRLASPNNTSIDQGVLLLLSADVMRRATQSFLSDETKLLKEYLFDLDVIKGLSSSLSVNLEVRNGLETLLRVTVDPGNADDRRLVSSFSSQWAEISRTQLDVADAGQIALWAQYMNSDDVLALLDQILENVDAVSFDLLSALLPALEQYSRIAAVELSLHSRLQRLIHLYSVFPQSQALQNIIATAVDTHLPLCLDGIPLRLAGQPSLSSITSRAHGHWANRLDPRTEDVDISVLLSQQTWTEQTVATLKGLVYLSPGAKNACYQYLDSDASVRRPMVQLASILYAWLDVTVPSDTMRGEPGDIWKQHFNNVVQGVLDDDVPGPDRLTFRLAIIAMVDCFPSLRSHFMSVLQDSVIKLSRDSVSEDLLLLGQTFLGRIPGDARTFLSHVLEHALQWAARHLAGPEKGGAHIMRVLATLVTSFSDVKAHVADTLVTAVVQNRLSDVDAVKLVSTIVPKAHLKPLLINRHLQSIVQHPQFFKYVDPSAPSRDAIVDLVALLFRQHPTNTCQPSHILPLASVYTGSLSQSDRRLLAVFQLYEETKKTSVASLLTQQSSHTGLVGNAREVIGNLDSNRVFRTCLAFPHWRNVDALEHDVETNQASGPQLYDPVYIILLGAQMLATSRPSSALEWVHFFRTNIVGLLIRSLSSKDDLLRDMALSQIASLTDVLRTADMQEKPHVLHILDLLKDAIRSVPDDEPCPRLPAFMSLFLAHALRGVFYPANFIYPLTARFLLQRPELDATDIPMLYNMLYSGADDWRKERSWLLKFVADAMLGARAEEWRVFRRRHTWDLLASVWQGGQYDRALRSAILEVLLNLTGSRRIAMSLVLKSGLLSWMEIVLLAPRDEECLLWMKVIDNILMVVDAEKLEALTSGEWRAAIGRCLGALTGEGASSLATLQLGTLLILKLSLLPGPELPNLESLLSQFSKRLGRLEDNIVIPETRVPCHPEPPQMLHTSYTAHEEPSLDPIYVWGEGVSALWRAAMAAGTKSAVWDELTARLLIWGTICDDAQGVGDWARSEVVRSVARPLFQ